VATLAGLVQDCFNAVYGIAQQKRPQEDTNNAQVLAAATSMTPDTPTMWKRGDYAEFQPDGEIVIFTADSAGATTIRKGQRGTTDAQQEAGDVILKNPTFPIHMIQALINEVVDHDLWPEVWSWHHDTLTFTAGDTTYNLDAYIEDVVMVYQYNLNSDGKFYPLERHRWRIERQINTAVSTNSNLLRLHSVKDETATVYYTAKRRPNSADLANLDAALEDLIPYAVLGKLANLGMIEDRYDPPRGDRSEREGGRARDYRTYMSEFLRMKNNYRKTLQAEVRPEREFVRKRTSW
jgi:hypothetical protein